MTVKIADPLLMREINKYHVLETIRCHSRISRVEISELTLLSATTVSAITGALIEEGFIEAIHVERQEGGKRGRPRVLLDLIADAAYVMGVRIAEGLITAVVANFKGEAVYSVQMPIHVPARGLDAVAELVENAVRVCIAAQGIDRAKIKGIGIGIPDMLDPESPNCFPEARDRGDTNSLGVEVERRLGLPVKTTNPALMVALAESWFGYAQLNRSFAAVTVDRTANLALWVEGDLFGKISGRAFGHIKIGNEGRRCACGQLDCLNAYIPGAHTGESQLAQGRTSSVKQGDGELAIAPQLDFEIGTDATSYASLGNKLGLAVSHIINLINPEKIIIVLDDSSDNGIIEGALRDCLSECSFDAHHSGTEILFDTIDEHGWARGAAGLMLRDIYKAPWSNE